MAAAAEVSIAAADSAAAVVEDSTAVVVAGAVTANRNERRRNRKGRVRDHPALFFCLDDVQAVSSCTTAFGAFAFTEAMPSSRPEGDAYP